MSEYLRSNGKRGGNAELVQGFMRGEIPDFDTFAKVG
jgi:hypothetical protein